MSRFLLPAVIALTTGAMLATPRPVVAQPAPVAPQDELVEKVRKAIDKGVRFLEKQQSPQGNWEGIVLDFLLDMEGGSTALVTLALLNCGVKPTEKSVKGGLDYLEKLPPKKTYVVGLQTMALAETRDAKYLPLIQKNVAWLIDTAIGLKRGELQGWSYPGNNIADNSNTQYALLGLYAAKQAGATIDDGTWKAIQKFYDTSQVKPTQTTGYWNYASNPAGGGGGAFGETGGSFTMTVAGVCGLIIAGMGLDQSEQQLDPATGAAKNCGVYAENTAIARGMNWITAKFNNYVEGGKTFDKFVQGKSTMYNVYGLERLGRLSGQRFIGKHDWYRDGCEYLLSLQDPASGFFSTRQGGIDGPNVVSTAFALLFLSKGRTPVLVTKFAWGDFQDRGGGTFTEVGGAGTPPGAVNWNRKHNDTRHLVEYASKELFKSTPLAWQVYDARRQDLSTKEKILTEVSVLLQSPVVYLNGHGELVLTPGQKEVLKKYVEEGGFLVGEACCGDPTFARSFRALMKELFPNNALAKLPPEHAIWRAYTDVSPADFPDLEGLERGCRTVAVFSPSPLAGFWEEAKYMPPVPKPNDPRQPAKNKGERAYRLAGNIIAYATGMELPKPKLTRAPLASSKDTTPGRSQFKPIQLKLRSESPAAPAAMRNLMSHMRETHRLDVAIESKPDSYQLFFSDDALAAFKFSYFHGRKPLQLDEFEAENLKANLQTGGLLLADAGCNGFAAWKEFDRSFRDAMKKMFPESQLQLIPADDPLFSAKMSGAALTTVRCRREKADGSGPDAEMKNVSPHLEGIKIDGRWVVLYSKYDIGCALEGHKAADCMGHDKESALKIASAAVLYSLKR
ncbi:MAG TPA: DUF4159 domain-containing protein [Gemmataceae bacterium]|nr:DUF4159 domain-containing protein [Gemmataceae bacterium]